jgi:hypothetical protein
VISDLIEKASRVVLALGIGAGGSKIAAAAIVLVGPGGKWFL